MTLVANIFGRNQARDANKRSETHGEHSPEMRCASDHFYGQAICSCTTLSRNEASQEWKS